MSAAESPVVNAPVATALSGGFVGGRVFNCRESPVIANELIAGMHPATGLVPFGAEAFPEPLAPIDRREPWWNIGDQGQTGACVGWAVGDGLMRYYLTKKGKLAEGERLSSRFIWMGAKETDEFVQRPTTFLETAGTTIRSALELCKKFGCVPENLLPDADRLTLQSETDFYAAANRLIVQPYIAVQNDPGVWKRWLIKEGPIVARLLVDHTFMNASGPGALLDDYEPFGNSSEMGHAVTIVGFTAEDTFIIRNSWGTSWGDQGFAYATIDYMQRFTEFFGVYFDF